MAYAIQLDLFEKNDDVSILYRELEKNHDEQEKLRRSLFARHGDLMKIVTIQQEEIFQLKRFLIDKHGAQLTDLTPVMPEPKKRKARCKADLHG